MGSVAPLHTARILWSFTSFRCWSHIYKGPECLHYSSYRWHNGANPSAAPECWRKHKPSSKGCQWLRITNDDLMTSFKMADEISRAIAVFQALIFSLLNNLLIKRWGQNLVKYPIASTSILPATAMISISDSSVYQAGAQWYSAP